MVSVHDNATVNAQTLTYGFRPISRVGAKACGESLTCEEMRLRLYNVRYKLRHDRRRRAWCAGWQSGALWSGFSLDVPCMQDAISRTLRNVEHGPPFMASSGC